MLNLSSLHRLFVLQRVAASSFAGNTEKAA
jgi:hypothetical protein